MEGKHTEACLYRQEFPWEQTCVCVCDRRIRCLVTYWNQTGVWQFDDGTDSVSRPRHTTKVRLVSDVLYTHHAMPMSVSRLSSTKAWAWLSISCCVHCDSLLALGGCRRRLTPLLFKWGVRDVQMTGIPALGVTSPARDKTARQRANFAPFECSEYPWHWIKCQEQTTLPKKFLLLPWDFSQCLQCSGHTKHPPLNTHKTSVKWACSLQLGNKHS